MGDQMEGNESGGGVIIVFSADASKKDAVDKAVEYMEQALKQHRLQITKHEASTPDDPRFMVVNAERQVMEAEAEHVKLMKEDKSGNLREFVTEAANETFKNYGNLDFFTASEQAMLVRSLVDHAQGGEDAPAGVTSQNRAHGALHALRLAGLVDDAMQAHRACSSRTKVWLTCLHGLGADVEGVNNYFGPQTAFYFGWMNFYCKWLTVPALAASVTFVHKSISGCSTDDHAYTPFYALVVVLWGALFQKYWKRQRANWSWRFGTALIDEVESDLRPEFRGEERISPVTGEKERWYPTRKRLVSYGVSTVVTGLMLAVAVIFMLCSMNLQGYMVVEENDYVTPIESYFFMPWLSKFAEKGGVLDANGYYQGYVPRSLGATVLHIVFIQGWNKAYRLVANKLTDRENHRTIAEHQNALMIKRFLFEAFDAYISLFYLAFIQFDMLKLRNELVSLYTVDSVRRISTECLLPMLVQTFSWDKDTLKRNAERRLKVLASKSVPGGAEADQIQERKYDPFDDYLEMVIQYGYMTLFASAFPFASALSLLTTFVEIKSDTFKLLFLYKRPVPRRTNDVGNWQLVMDVTTILAVTTNCMLFALSSEQLMQWVPKWYLDEDGPDAPLDQQFREGMGRYVVGVCFGVEHILMLVVAFFWMAIPSQSQWVRNQIKRIHFMRARAAREAKLKKLE